VAPGLEWDCAGLDRGCRVAIMNAILSQLKIFFKLDLVQCDNKFDLFMKYLVLKASNGGEACRLCKVLLLGTNATMRTRKNDRLKFVLDI
jgi:hypothetical protein